MLFFIFLPLLNFLFAAFLGRFLGKAGTLYLTLYNILLCIAGNLSLFYMVLGGNVAVFFNFGAWLEVSGLLISWEFVLDPLAVVILAIVSLIAGIVHLYSFSYIKADPHFIRFMSYLSLFTFFIFVLVTSANFILLFIGWEGVGICSYLLINFWNTRIQANKAAIKAMLINRLGDIGFLVAIVLVFTNFGSLDFAVLQAIVPIVKEARTFVFMFGTMHLPVLDMICIFLLVGVVGKSAQLGLHTWLPSAIEGPTPVSALIHAATIVTAGVFLLIRVCFLFELSPAVQTFIVILGALTALLSAFTAIFLYDLKRIIAYSTCSQLGYITLSAGLSQYNLALFHLVNHAFFKALLFLAAGAVIHSYNNEQDIRKIAGVFFKTPFVYATFTVGNIAIMGIPFLAGFYSKDLIIELAYLTTNNTYTNILVTFNLLFVFIIVATFFTCVYSIRIFYFLFVRQKSYHTKALVTARQPLFIQLSLALLMCGSILSGYVFSDLFANTSYIFYAGNELAYQINSSSALMFFQEYWNSRIFFLENEFLPWTVKLAPFLANLIGMLVGFYIIQFYYRSGAPASSVSFWQVAFLPKKLHTDLTSFLTPYFMNGSRGSTSIKMAQNNFYFNEAYNYFALASFCYYYTDIFKNLDKGILEYLGPTGFSKIYFSTAKYFTAAYNENLVTHFFIILNTLFLLLFILEVWA